MTRGGDPAARLRASLLKTLRGLRRCLRLPDLPHAELEALLASPAAMSELEGMAARAGLPGVARALAALALGVVGGSVRLQNEAAPSAAGLLFEASRRRLGQSAVPEPLRLLEAQAAQPRTQVELFMVGGKL